MERVVKIIVLALCFFAASSCSKENAPELPSDEVAPVANNEYKPIILDEKQKSLALNGNAMADKYLYTVLTSEEKDFMISPLGLQIVLGMVMNGASDAAFKSACEALGYNGITRTDLNEYLQLMALSMPAIDKLTKLESANMAVVNNKFSLKEDFVNILHRYYDAYVKNEDFSNLSVVAGNINAWCNNNTHGLIPSVSLPLKENTVMAILDALYFKSAWTDKFSSKETSKEYFYFADGTRSKVNMMKKESYMNVSFSNKCTYLKLPFGNGAFYMMIALPNKGVSLEEMLEQGTSNIDWIIANVDLWMPKFKIEYTKELNEILEKMGLGCLIDGNFSNISSALEQGRLLYQQDTAFEVNEEGTTASAVTSVTGFYTSAGPDSSNPAKLVLHLDRPFVYYIRESSTGATLFAGRYGAKAN